MSANSSALALDHRVVAAASLEQGVAWCETTLGVPPGPGGRHALMSTHNRLLTGSTAMAGRPAIERRNVLPATQN